MLRSPRLPQLLVVPVAFALLGSLCPKESPRGKTPSAEPPLELAALSVKLSEPAGYFDSDNLISNETSYLQVADALSDKVPAGGVYIGVGPDQNFSYIARLRPSYAFILDIRRQNTLQHLLFASILADADDPYQYLCRLFSRPCPAQTPEGAAGDGVEKTLQALSSVAPSEETFSKNLQAAYRYIEGTLAFGLEAQDRTDLRAISRAFFDDQTEIRFRSYRRPWALYHPTFRTLLTLRSPSGRFGNFLDSREDYRFVSEMARAQRIVPVVGDFAGPRALRAIGQWVREHGLYVSVFYTSNVEFYLLRNDAFQRFAANVRELPTRPESTLVRACFDYGRSHPAELPGHRSATLMQRIDRFGELYAAGSYTSYWDVCTLDYVH